MMQKSISHQSQKILHSDYNHLWRQLYNAGEQNLITPKGHKFTAVAAKSTRGTHQWHEVIFIKHYNKEFARIYSCCWGHTTNCHGTRIGGYSDGLDSWAKGIMIRAESLLLKPEDEVVRDLGKLFSSAELDFNQAVKHLPKEPGVYLVYDRKQKRFIYIGSTLDINNRIRQHLRLQKKGYFHGQQIQKGLIAIGRCNDSKDAQKYLSANCTAKHLVIPDEKRRKYPWIRRTLLTHYAICVLQPEYNVSAELDN